MRHSRTSATSTSFTTWYGVLSGPVIWSAHLLISYLLVSTACSAGVTSMRLLIGAITVVAEALILAGGAIGYQQRDRDGPRGDAEAPSTSFLARFSVLASALFCAATLFTAAPVFVLRTCG